MLLTGGSTSPRIGLVAERIGTSVRTLQRHLRATGLTYADVVERARRAEAQRMLKERQSPIGDIARALGYSDPAHFTRAFLRWTGITPRDFRRQCAAIEERRPLPPLMSGVPRPTPAGAKGQEWTPGKRQSRAAKPRSR